MLNILVISRHPKYQFNPDALLKAIMIKWIVDQKPIRSSFITQLFIAIDDLKCMDGVILRLNLDVVPFLDQPSSRNSHQKIEKFLRQHNFYDASSSCDKLKAANCAYSLEQSILTLIGYLVIGAAIDAYENNIKFYNNRLLVLKN